jgi:thiol-disulfide isomerase/thioredoxin
MRWFFLFLLLINLGGAACAYHLDPDGFMHRVNDLKGRVTALWGQPAPADSTAPEVTPANQVAPGLASGPSAPQAPAASRTAVWAPPAVIPAQGDWTWTTSEGTYHKVRILKVEADCVTILDDEGGALVPIAELPASLQQQLNYDPAASAAAAAVRQRDDAVSSAVLARERAAAPGGTAQSATDYPSALAQARLTGQRVLLHFTGSDWCPYCKYLESEVIETGAFQQFVAGHYIFMTVDFPRSNPLPADAQAQNNALQRKFGVSGFPTLLVIDGNERVLGQMAGYNPGSGPGPVIAQLQSFH